MVGTGLTFCTVIVNTGPFNISCLPLQYRLFGLNVVSLSAIIEVGKERLIWIISAKMAAKISRQTLLSSLSNEHFLNISKIYVDVVALKSFQVLTLCRIIVEKC